jgi:integrative and conjugative element protein (TIGR02256 family)
MEHWTSPDGRYSVRLEGAFLLEASRLAREHYPNEVGTPLVGEYTDDGTEARVTALGPLTSDSRGTRFTFTRGVRGLRGFFGRLFNTSRGRVHYVGEWHSHPGGGPVPSSTDDTNMMAIAQDMNALCPECVLVLLAGTPGHMATGVFVYSRSRGRLRLTRNSDAAADAV